MIHGIDIVFLADYNYKSITVYHILKDNSIPLVYKKYFELIDYLDL